MMEAQKDGTILPHQEIDTGILNFWLFGIESLNFFLSDLQLFFFIKSVIISTIHKSENLLTRITM